MKYLVPLCLVLSFYLSSCSIKTSKEVTTTEDKKPAPTTESASNKEKQTSEKPASDSIKSLKAKFVEFTLGDAEHYTFKDESGKEWEFGGNDSKIEFGVELSKAETNSGNQGWGSDKKLQGKWFNIKYVIRRQPQYQDGPMADVPVIISAEQEN